jgi:ABC-type branched-subunit amino acid transport system ATPase component
MASKKNKLKVISIEARDVLGIKEYSMEPGQVTVVSGKNGVGKTSAIALIESVLGGGSLAKIARIGDEGEEIDPQIVVVMETDEGQQYMVEKSTKGTRVRSQVGDSAGYEDVPKPARFLSGLYDGKLANPIEFMKAKSKDRVLMLLGALPLELDRKQLWADMGITKKEIGPVPEGLHPLQELALIRESIFRERTGVNRDAKGKFESAEQTRRATPAVLPESHEAEIEKLSKYISDSEIAITERIEQAKSAYQAGCTKANNLAIQEETAKLSKHESWANKKRSDLEKSIAEQKMELETLIREDLKETNKVISEYTNLQNETKEELLQKQNTIIDDAFQEQSELETERTQLTELREQAKEAIRARTLHEQANQFEADAEELKARSQRLTNAISTLDARRRAMAKDLPIPGLEVDGKEIKVDGVIYDQLNTAKQIDIAVAVSCLRAKDFRLPIAWVDGAEALDSENFNILVECLNEKGVQALIGQRTEGSLQTKVVK